MEFRNAFDNIYIMKLFTPNTVVTQPRLYIVQSACYALHTSRVQYSTRSMTCENRYRSSALGAGLLSEYKLAKRAYTMIKYL